MISSRNVLHVGSPGFAQTAVAATEPPAAWIGGKRNLARRICAILSSTPHQAYVEPFIGMGGVFLRRRMRPPVEVINDVSGDIVTLFRVLQRFPDALLRECRWRPAMRAEFDRLRESRDPDLLDIERAARFLYLQSLAFGGKAFRQNFGTDTHQAHNFDIGRLEPRLRRLHDRLQGVVIEQLDWMDCLGRYDRPHVLFYLDPPYWGRETDYGPRIFARSDFQRLAERLQRLEGSFLLSINDVPEIRELFAWAKVEAVETTYSLAGGDKAKTAKELLIGRGGDLTPAAPPPGLF